MSYNSKRTVTSMAAGLALVAAYVLYAANTNISNLRTWGVTMLAFLGIAVAAMVVIQILFHTVFAVGLAVQEQDSRAAERILASSMVEDERDRLIGLKSSRIGYTFAGAGLVAMLAALALGFSAVFALHILLGAFAFGGLAEGTASVILHERGLRNG